MRRMYAIGLGMMLAAAATVPAAAQDAGAPPPDARGGWHGGPGHRGMGPGHKGEAMLRQALRGITLTDAQKAQLKTLQERHHTEMKQFFDSHRPQGNARPDSAARAQMRQQMMQLHERHQSELRAILTPAQQATFDKNVAEMKQRRQQKGMGMGMRRPHGDRDNRPQQP